MQHVHSVMDSVLRTGSSRTPRRVRAFTLIELLVVIAIISLLVSILLPSLKKAKDLARTAICMSQIRSAGLGMALYVEEWDQAFPIPFRPSNNVWGLPGALWSYMFLQEEYISDINAVICPSLTPGDITLPSEHEWFLPYMTLGMAGFYHSSGIDRDTSTTAEPHDNLRVDECWNPTLTEIALDTIIMGVARPSWVYMTLNIPGPVQTASKSKHRPLDSLARVHFRHQRRANILFADSHVESANDGIEIVHWSYLEDYGTGQFWEFYAVEIEQ